VGELRESVVGVDRVHEDVAARGEVGDVDLLALEVGVAVDAVADRDPLAQVGQVGPALAAVGLVEGRRAASAPQRPAGRCAVAVAEAEAGLVISPEPEAAAGGAARSA
jgi:hypothetical protein